MSTAMKTAMKAATTALALVLAAATSGCASRPPRELQDARIAYQRAETTPGAPLAQTDLHSAKRALNDAETKFADDGNEPETRDLAYVAQRKALSAQAKANAAQSIAQKRMAEADLQKFKDNRAASLQGQLESAKGALASERQARQAADQKATDALSTIVGLQSKQSNRGLVLTLSGSVLFATGKSVLLPEARSRLTEVAKALAEDKREITVVGHTDATGSDETNQRLSEARAEAVRKQLISQGIEESRVRASGMGEKEPVASNDSPDGRANNRRVEIILENPTAPAR